MQYVYVGGSQMTLMVKGVRRRLRYGDVVELEREIKTIKGNTLFIPYSMWRASK